MFGNNNNNTDKKSVNSKGITIFSDLSFLALNFWNSNISLTLGPASSKGIDGRTIYAEDKRYNTSIVLEKALMLYNDINKIIIPEIEKYESTKKFTEDISVGFDVGKNKTSGIFIEWKKLEGEEDPCVFLTYYNDIDANNVAGEMCRYRFGRQNSILNYNHLTGSGIISRKESEFWIFVKLLETHIHSLGISYHGEKYSIDNEYKGRQTMNNTRSTQPSAGGFDDDSLPF